MANETSKLLLSTQQEKPNHYTYLKEFRVEQCQSFLQHKCNQHRPFICFNWHFQNQRRRRPIRKRDGTFNYSADNYCTKYDETTGICPDGDDCPFLHRTAGDTERRYHLRYYKTCMCVHDTDSRGYCVKNGHHCAFAHGIQDQRPPVYDIKELEQLQNSELALDGTNAQNALDKERNLMNEDPKWQDTNYVLANYKTEPCKRPPRLCRQGYACPQYHNSKDKRRSPRKFKYRSTPCPNVKHGEEWGEPGNCEAGDNCQYCHTRTEQQFHPEIYKSTKCNDVQQAGYCPRSVFCAFAHVEPYIITEDKSRELDGITTNIALSDLISNALPELKSKESSNGKTGTATLMSIGDNANGKENSSSTSLAASTVNCSGASLTSNSTLNSINTNDTSSSTTTLGIECINKAPGAHLTKKLAVSSSSAPSATLSSATTATVNASLQNGLNNLDVTNSLKCFLVNGFKDSKNSLTASSNVTTSTAAAVATAVPSNVIDSNINKISGNPNLLRHLSPSFSSSELSKLLNMDGNDTNSHTNNILVNALEKSANQSKFINFPLPLEKLSSCSIEDPRDNSLSASLANTSLLTRSSAPINIPNNALNNSINDFSTGNFAVNIPNSSLTYSPTNHVNLFSVSDAFNYANSNNSNKLSNSLSAATQNDGSNLFFPSRIISPGFADGLSVSPSVRISELNSVRDDINNSGSMSNSLFDNGLTSNKNAFSLQSMQNQNNINDVSRIAEIMAKNTQIMKLTGVIEETTRKINLLEMQNDKTKQEAIEWKERFEMAQTQLNLHSELRHLSIQKLKQLQSKLRTDLEEVEKVLYLENAKKCMKCEENNRTVTLEPCNHFILCDKCAQTVKECPYCQAPVVTTHT